MSIYATDFDSTRAFYVAVLAELDYSVQAEMVMDSDPDLPGRRACAFGSGNRKVFWVIEVPESYTPRHFAFAAEDRECVAAFHAAGIAAGGQDHGAPGPRPIYQENYFGAFLTDPDGNNVEAVCRTAP